jgi:hypothetical protein
MHKSYGKNTTIFPYRVVHWVNNYMFRPWVLPIFRFYNNLSIRYTSVLGVLWGNEISSYNSGRPWPRPPTIVRRNLVPPGYPTHIFYIWLISCRTTWRWPIPKAETCSFIPNVLLYMEKYSCILTIWFMHISDYITKQGFENWRFSLP